MLHLPSQALRWPMHDTSSTAPAAAAAAAADTSSSTSGVSNAPGSAEEPKRQIRITLPDASYEPAAMAVLAALYLIKPVQDLMTELTQQQQLQAAVLADKWQVSMASTTAIQLLTAAENSAEGLDAATVDQLLLMAAVPDCLLPLLECAVLRRFGDLEAVWANIELRNLLMRLPLHAMELLLASGKLKVKKHPSIWHAVLWFYDAMTSQSADMPCHSVKRANGSTKVYYSWAGSWECSAALCVACAQCLPPAQRAAIAHLQRRLGAAADTPSVLVACAF
jgi:hypothetical protein